MRRRHEYVDNFGYIDGAKALLADGELENLSEGFLKTGLVSVNQLNLDSDPLLRDYLNIGLGLGSSEANKIEIKKTGFRPSYVLAPLGAVAIVGLVVTGARALNKHIAAENNANVVYMTAADTAANFTRLQHLLKPLGFNAIINDPAADDLGTNYGFDNNGTNPPSWNANFSIGFPDCTLDGVSVNVDVNKNYQITKIDGDLTFTNYGPQSSSRDGTVFNFSNMKDLETNIFPGNVCQDILKENIQTTS